MNFRLNKSRHKIGRYYIDHSNLYLLVRGGIKFSTFGRQQLAPTQLHDPPQTWNFMPFSDFKLVIYWGSWFICHTSHDHYYLVLPSFIFFLFKVPTTKKTCTLAHSYMSCSTCRFWMCMIFIRKPLFFYTFVLPYSKESNGFKSLSQPLSKHFFLSFPFIKGILLYYVHYKYAINKTQGE